MDAASDTITSLEAKRGIAKLPTELLLEIWGYLDTWNEEPASFTKFDDLPKFNFLNAKITDIKSISSVSREWRSLVLPDLFKYAHLQLDGASRGLVVQYSLLDDLQSAASLSPNEKALRAKLEQEVKELGKEYGRTAIWYSTHGIVHIHNEDKLLLSRPHRERFWYPPGLAATRPFLEFLKRNKLERIVHSLVVYTSGAYPEKPTQLQANYINTQQSTFWEDILANTNPPRIMVAAPPSTMAFLTESRLSTEDTRDFGADLHYLELRQQACSVRETPTYFESQETAISCRRCLHNLRPWTHLSYNEGSFLPAYNTYEFFNKRPPQILPTLLLWLYKEARYNTPPKLQSFSYRAIFPFSSHVQDIMRNLEQLSEVHAIGTMDLRIAPDPASSILEDPARVLRADLNDCWSEFERGYKAIVKCVPLGRGEVGKNILVRDYAVASMEATLDKAFRRLKTNGWVREKDCWVKRSTTGIVDEFDESEHE